MRSRASDTCLFALLMQQTGRPGPYVTLAEYLARSSPCRRPYAKLSFRLLGHELGVFRGLLLPIYRGVNNRGVINGLVLTVLPNSAIPHL